MKIIEFGLKWVHMARYELILRLDGALWLTIIFRPLLTPKRPTTRPLANGRLTTKIPYTNKKPVPILHNDGTLTPKTLLTWIAAW